MPEPLATHVADHNGTPTLFVNGRPHDGLMFWHSVLDRASPDIANFGRCGVHLFTTGFGPGQGWLDIEQLDRDAIDARMETILQANPDALVMPRLSINPPAAWHRMHPGQSMVHRDWQNGDIVHQHASVSSPVWQRTIEQTLPAMVEHFEDRWGDRVVAYHPTGGATGEFSYCWNTVVSDLSPAQHEAYRAWLRRTYDNDPAALRAAWGDPSANFDSAVIPDHTLRSRRNNLLQGSLRDPATDRAVIDYLRFHSQVMGETAVWACTLVKDTLRRLNRQKVCGVFYAYHFFSEDYPHPLHNAGHHYHDAILESPDVDFVASPISYQQRQPGGAWASHLLIASLRLHGKLVYNEDDTFTHLAKLTPWRYNCRDTFESCNILRRNLVGALTSGSTQWWMDHDGDGWYREDALLEEVTRQRELARQMLDTDRQTAAEVAVLCSEDAIAFCRHDDALSDALTIRQLFEITKLGAPVDFYRVNDLPALLDSPLADQYRLWVFMDPIYVSPANRELIRNRLAGGGRTLLWIYAAGLATDQGLSPEAMSELIGIDVRLDKRIGNLLAETAVTGRRIVYGTDRRIGPILSGDDDQAEILGRLLYRGEPGLLRKTTDTARTWWSAAPTLPSALLRTIADQAGVHLYARSDDRIYASRQLLAVHAGADGPVELCLPAPAAVIDAISGDKIGEGMTRFTTQCRRGQTRIFRLQPDQTS